MALSVQLDAIEARLLGVLIEKQLTTPDQYPLSLNAATNGANQKSNRDPVLSLEEDEVAEALHRLEQKYLVRKVFSRVERYLHNGRETLALEAPQLAILAELLMRGPQMPGELRTRVSRMSPIDSQEHLQQLLQPLLEGGFIERLAPSPGTRAERYVQLVSPGLHPVETPAPAASGTEARVVGATAPALEARVVALEGEVARLRSQLETLAAKLGEPIDHLAD
jgi:uncharacterized protein YceH (UPF0502 family)